MVFNKFCNWVFRQFVDFIGHSICCKEKKVRYGHDFYLKIMWSKIVALIFRFNLHKVSRSNTVFILNLAFWDFLYCGINLPFYSLQYLHQSWDWGLTLCIVYSNIRYINAFADWMSVALIAASRCITVTKPKKMSKLFATKRNRVITLMCLWLYSFLLLIPTNCKVQYLNTYLNTLSKKIQI